jgi:YCII-related domain
MANYIFTYRPPKDSASAPSEDAFAAWTAWFERISDSVVDRGAPVFERTTLGGAPTDTVLGGYSLVRAEDLEAAVALAKGCPILERGGAVEVGVLTDM